YYRINYDETLWTKISTALGKSDFGKIDDLNRAQLVDDTYNLAKAEKRTYSQFLDFVKFLNHETSYYPWSSAFSAFSSMLLRTEDQNIKSALSNYILDLMTALKIEVPFSEDNDDDPIYTQNRVTALSWACRLGDGVCIQKSKAVFNYYKEMNM
ncbi:ERAP1 C domain containing protein, partial [Asbolus verrucosus]